MLAANNIQSPIPGQQWIRVTSSLPSAALTALYAGGRFLVAGINGYFATSTNAQTWSVSNRNSADWVFSASYIPSSGRYVLPAGNTSYYSTDGATWTAGGTMFSSAQFVRTMSFGGSTMLALGANSLGESPRAATSSDGATWTDRGLLSSLVSGWPTGVSIFSTTGTQNAAYGAGVFVVVATASSTAYCATTPNGVTWTDRSASLQSALGSVLAVKFVVWVPRLSRFFVGARGGKMATSTDGITWSAVTLPSWITGSDDLINMADVSGQLVLMVSNSKVGTSPNGVNWTYQPAFSSIVPSTSNDASGVAVGGAVLLTTATNTAGVLTVSI